MSKPKVIRRTFEAKKYPVGSAKRAELNRSSITSEYLPGDRYLVQTPFIMSDSSTHPTQPFIYRGFRTKREAEENI